MAHGKKRSLFEEAFGRGPECEILMFMWSFGLLFGGPMEGRLIGLGVLLSMGSPLWGPLQDSVTFVGCSCGKQRKSYHR